MKDIEKVNIQNLSLSFLSDEKTYIKAIDNLSLKILPGQIFALLGESGCGKSLTASSIMQLLPLNAYCSTSSKIYFDDKDLLTIPEKQMQHYRGLKISMIFQEPMTSLNPVMTIGLQLIEIINRTGKYSKKELKEKAIGLLNQVEIPEPERRFYAYPHQLSGGQKQRVMIAMAIAAKVDLLIADEPTTALDVTIQAQILALLQKLTKELQMALLLITHDLSVVEQFADKVGIMYAGQMVECTEADHFFRQPMHPYSQKLLECVPSLSKRGQRLTSISGVVPSLREMPVGCRFMPRCQHAQISCKDMPVMRNLNGRVVRCHLAEQISYSSSSNELEPQLDVTKVQGDVVLSVSDLKVYFPIKHGLLRRHLGDVKAVDGVTFNLRQGQTLALVGESGCGKTTLSRAICQLIPKTAGEITLLGQELKAYNKAASKQLQIVFQDPFASMNPRMLVEDILLEGIYAQQSKIDGSRLRAHAKKLLDLVGLPANSLERYPHEFSGGQRQRISIARAIAVDPKVLICDEPTSALDVSIQAQILNLLIELQKELGLAYLFISHDLAVVGYLADEIMVMREGKIIEYGETEQIISGPQQAYTKQLLAAVA